MPRRGEHEERRTVEYIGGSGEHASGPTQKDRAAAGDAKKVKGDDAKHMWEIAQDFIAALNDQHTSPLEWSVGINVSASPYFSTREGTEDVLDNNELAYLVQALERQGVKVRWNGHDYIATRAEQDDDNDASGEIET